MEYIEGRTLASFLAGGGKPTPIQGVELADKIAGALAAAHAQGIVHRDIKPANVMVTRAGEVKVMDFGIARLQSDATAPQTSSVIGTPAYFSPEQAQGQPVDARSDIYSLGCVLYELLAHRPPFTGDTPVAIAYKQVNESPVPPSQVNPDVPPRLDAVVMKCMAKNPANRYQSAAELSEDLDRVRQGPGGRGHAAAAGRRRRRCHPGDRAPAHPGDAPARARDLLQEGVARRADRDPHRRDPGGRRVPAGPEPERRRRPDHRHDAAAEGPPVRQRQSAARGHEPEPDHRSCSQGVGPDARHGPRPRPDGGHHAQSPATR